MAEITNTNPRGAGRMKKSQPISVAICLRLTEAEAKAVRASKHTKRNIMLAGLDVLEKSSPTVQKPKKGAANLSAPDLHGFNNTVVIHKDKQSPSYSMP